MALPLRTWFIKCCLLTGKRERSLYTKPLCLVFLRDLCHTPRRRWMTSCALLASMDTIRRKHPHMTLLCTTRGRPRAHTRTREPPRRTTEVHLLGHHGIEPHLGQKPKIGGGIPTSHTSIYLVSSVLCISVFSLSF